MSWKLFLDDERYPADSDKNEYVICRCIDHVAVALAVYGPLTYATFDHDLGEKEPTGMEVVKFLVERDIEDGGVLADNFTWYVHSQNPVGAENINEYLKCYMKHRGGL